MTTYGQSTDNMTGMDNNPPMFQAEGEQHVIRIQQQPPLVQQTISSQGYVVQSGIIDNSRQPYGQTPMVAQAVPVNYIPQAQYAVAAVPIGLIHPTRGAWSDGLCECFNDCESCLLAYLIPPILFGRNAKRSGLGEFGSSFMMYFVPWLLIIIMYVLFNNDVIGSWGAIIIPIAALICAILGCMLRGKLRQKYSIPGDQMEDMLMHCCCAFCALAQESRHINRANQAANAPQMVLQQPMGIYAQPPQHQQQQQQGTYAQQPTYSVQAKH